MSARAVDLLMFSSYLFFIFSCLLVLFLTIFAQTQQSFILYTLEEAKRFSLVIMSVTDRKSLVSLDRDLVHTIEGASDISTKCFCYPHW